MRTEVVVADRSRGSFHGELPRLYGRAYQAAFRLCGDRCAAEDAALEALTRAYVRWPRLDDRREGWVVTVPCGSSSPGTGERRATQPLRPLLPPMHPSPPTRTRRAGRPPPPPGRAARRQREVAVLRYLEDHSEADVAAALGFSVGSVKRHAWRALLRCALDAASYEGDRTLLRIDTAPLRVITSEPLPSGLAELSVNAAGDRLVTLHGDGQLRPVRLAKWDRARGRASRELEPVPGAPDYARIDW